MTFENEEKPRPHNISPDASSASYIYAVPSAYQGQGDEISLIDLWRVLMKYKRMIAAVVGVFVICAMIIAWITPPVYKADVLLAPSANIDGNNGVGIANQLGGLANLVGINIGNGSNVDNLIAILKSRKFLTHFISTHKLKPILFEDRWDGVKKSWVVKDSFFSSSRASSLSGNESPTDLDPGEPTDEQAYKKFLSKILNVTQDNKTQLITISIEWKDPHLAAEWANTLVKTLNDELRQNAIDEAERSIAYLKEQINQTSLADLQNLLYRIIEEHTKNITLAKVSDEYALKVIDPAVAPEVRFKPKIKLILIIGLFLGLIAGVILSFIVNAIHNFRAIEDSKPMIK